MAAAGWLVKNARKSSRLKSSRRVRRLDDAQVDPWITSQENDFAARVLPTAKQAHQLLDVTGREIPQQGNPC